MVQNNPNPIQFGELFMEEMGLYIDPYGRVVDQQTDSLLQVKGKSLRFPLDGSVRLSKGEMEFDPLNNQTLANNLFGFYIQNRLSDNGNVYVSNYCTVASPDDKDKGILEVKTETGTIKSGEYYRDSLKYADMMMRMNGTPNVDLSEFDQKPQPKKPNKR